MSAQVKGLLDGYAALVDVALRDVLDAADVPPLLAEAMNYSVFPGGKRLRPVLSLAAARACGKEVEVALAPALAFELIHCCSLVHDDLPCMDDDDMRRGKPSCHKAYGEAMAVLTGDALMTLAFEVMARAGAAATPEEASRLARATIEVAVAAGPQGMIGGQVLDINPPSQLTIAELDQINRMKTGALIVGSVRAGAIAAGADRVTLEALTLYGRELGRAFQICDDILDAATDGTTDGNPGYPALVGSEQARETAAGCIRAGHKALEPLGENGSFLRDLATMMFNRTS